MSYSFIKIIPRGNYLTLIDLKNNPRYMCFANKEDAINCITYISTFRSKYGYFPHIDLTKTTQPQKIKANVSLKKRTRKVISNMMSIETMDQTYLDDVCCKNSLGLFYIHNFSYTLENSEINLSLSAQELDSEPNMYRYMKNLNDIFEN